MKTSFLSALVILATGIPSPAQLLMNEGDVFTYEFSSLTLVAEDVSGLPPLGNFSVILNPGTVQSGDTIKLEMFETSLMEAPIGSVTVMNQSLLSCQTYDAWDDRQGAIRITMMVGSARLDTFTIRALTAREGSPLLNAWETTVVPIPEPGTLGLLGLAMAAGWALNRPKHARKWAGQSGAKTLEPGTQQPRG